MESSIRVRKVAQDVLRFVLFKHKIIGEPTLDYSFMPEISPDFINNLCIAVWMQTFRIDNRWKGFLRKNFERMTSTSELYATYVSYACYTFAKDSTAVYSAFFEALSTAIYFGLRCWERDSEEFINISVELFSIFYNKELRKNFEENGSWEDFNDFLENNLDLVKYKLLIDDNIWPFEYFKHTKDEREKEIRVCYAIQLYLLTKVTQKKVESNEKAVSFGKYAADKLEELRQQTLDDILDGFAEVDSQIEEFILQNAGKAPEGLVREVDQISPRKCRELPENIGSSPKDERKELDQQTEATLNSSEIFVDTDNSCNQMEDASLGGLERELKDATSQDDLEETKESISTSSKSGNQVEDVHSEMIGESFEGLKRDLENMLSQNAPEKIQETSSSSNPEKRELVCKVRKLTQDVLLFVWFKYKIIKEKSLPDLTFTPEISPECLNNLCISVWIQSFRNDFKWKGFLERHFKRLTSSVELFANYVSYACYTLIENTTNAFAGFFDVLSLITYFGLRCWQDGSKEFLNTSVALVCSFFEKELLETFEDQGNWEDFNEYLETNFDLAKYKSLIDGNIWPAEYFKTPQDERVEDSEISYALQCIRQERVSEIEVETNEKAVSFAKSVADQLEELIQKTFDYVLSGFAKTDSEVEENYRKIVGEASGGWTAKLDHDFSQNVHYPEENIPRRNRCRKNELYGEIRKITQDVLLFVWFKHKIIKEEPLPCLGFDPEITLDFMNNLRIAVWMQSFRNDFKWKGFLKIHFKRMTSTAELFANYVYFASHTLVEDATNVHASLFNVLSLVAYFVLCCWEKGYEAFLNTSVELVCAFFKQELLEKFENQGSWMDFNSYLETSFNLTKYKSLNNDNILPSQYFKQPEDRREEGINLSLALDCINLEEIAQSVVETNEQAISFAKSVADQMEKLCQQPFDQVFAGFTKTNNQVVEIYRQTVGETSGELAREVDHILSENVETSKFDLSKTKSEVKELIKQMVTSHSSVIRNADVPTGATSRLSPRSKKVRKLLKDISNDYLKLGELIQILCDKHNV